MCNINLIYRKDRKDLFDLSKYMNTASWASYTSNDDGNGVFALSHAKTTLLKQKNFFTFNKACYFLATHQRLTTSGLSVGNTHPHETSNLILMHNGIFADLGNADKSDSRFYANKLEKAFQDNGFNLVKAIQEVSLQVGGSYSILVYDKMHKKMYYYKESSTKMFKVEDSRYLVMSTRKDNLEFAKICLGITTKIKEVEPLKIYDLFDNFKEKSSFKEKQYSYVSQFNNGYETYYFGRPSDSPVVTETSNENGEAILTEEKVDTDDGEAEKTTFEKEHQLTQLTWWGNRIRKKLDNARKRRVN